MRNLCTLLLATWLLLATSAGHAQSMEAPTTDADTTEPTAQDLEELVQTLEDPTARAELVGDLKLLLDARKKAQAEETAVPDGKQILDTATGILEDIWEKLTSLDPRAVLISCLLTVCILIGAVVLRWLLRAGLRRLYRRLARVAEGADEEADTGTPEGKEEEQEQLPPTIMRLLNLIIGIIAVVLVAESWGAEFRRVLATQLGARLIEMVLVIGLILIITVALWNAAELIIERLVRFGARNLDRERTARRLDALVPLLRSVVQATIGVFAALLVLSELGVNIGPLLAGAGILGLAVGFGAQTLVKDLITGVTILLEDGATVGDVVEVAGHGGVVEEMRIRVMQLRDLSGNVHLVPYSEVTTIKNFTKEWSYYLFEVGVAYREDTDEVCRILAEIGEQLQGDEKFGEDIMEPLEILGVDQFADSAVIIKARLKTKPIRQWAVGREFNRRMKKRFDEEGIEIPFPHTTIYFGESKEGTAPPLRIAEQRADGEKD